VIETPTLPQEIEFATIFNEVIAKDGSNVRKYETRAVSILWILVSVDDLGLVPCCSGEWDNFSKDPRDSGEMGATAVCGFQAPNPDVSG
jgi:beta-glucosidase-like glycosyl hydrolase